jgi:hypothetical protein
MYTYMYLLRSLIYISHPVSSVCGFVERREFDACVHMKGFEYLWIDGGMQMCIIWFCIALSYC